ncbi:MAG: HEAT repeat domain-containing protein [Opitutaceae bacterium]
MNCQSAREAFPELLDRRSATTTRADARTHLASCPDCQREFAALNQTLVTLDAMPAPSPSSRLRKNFYAMLEEEKNSAVSVRAAARREHRVTLWRWFLAPAFGCALLLAGFLAGTRVVATAPTPTTDEATKRELAQIKRQMEKMTQLVGNVVQQQQLNPTNDRLQDVLLAAKAENPSDQVIDTLLSALALDPSAAVRLRALQALYAHAGREVVRSNVIAALPRERNPNVQLEMIDFVATSLDPNATSALEQLSQNEQVDAAVRDGAKRALAQL